LGKALESVVCFCFGQAEGGEEADDIAAGDACEYVFGMEEDAAKVFDGGLHFKADHEAFSSYFLYVGKVVEAVNDALANVGGVSYQIFRFHDVEDGYCCSAGEVITAKSATKGAVFRLEHGANQDAANWETIAHAFGDGNEVGADAGVLVGEKFAGAAVAGLDFVNDHADVVFCAQTAEIAQELVGGDMYSADALYAFNDDGGNIAFAHLLLNLFGAVEGEEDDLHVCVWSYDEVGIVCYAGGGGGSAVKGFGEGDYACAAVVEGGYLDGVLVGLGACINKEEGIVGVTAGFAKFLGEVFLQWVLDGVGIEAEAGELLCECFYVCGMAMTNGNDGVATVEVKIFLAVCVPYVAAEASGYVYVKFGIYVEQFHFVVVFYCFRKRTA
jgi:hypothetical protein